MALWHFLSAPEDPEEAVVNAVMAGHDADTVASMTGAYAGAYLGDHSFPSRWSGDDLEFADELRDLAGRLLIVADDEAGS
jgi:ADP-ribosylglycohydrolase